MMVDATHQILRAQLELNFDDAGQAEHFERQASAWVNQQLLPLIEHIFDQFCPGDQTFAIDKLVLDLGHLSNANLLEKLLQAIQSQLTAQLSQHLLAHEQSVTQANSTIAAPEQQWQRLRRYLQYGTFAWSVNNQQSVQDLALNETLMAHIPQLEQLLAQSRAPEQLLSRIISQFSDETLLKLWAQLSVSNQSLLAQLLALTHQVHTFELQNVVKAYYQREFESALAHHQLQPLHPIWALLLSQYSAVILHSIEHYRADPRLPYLLTRQLNLEQRLLLLQQLEPQEYPFLYQVIQHPELWEYTPSDIALPYIDEQIWLFTWHFLLLERGSEFNKQSYLLGLLSQMASLQNTSFEMLVKALKASVERSAIASHLHQAMTRFLSQALISSQPQQQDPLANTGDNSMRRFWLQQQLLSGTIGPYLPQLITQYPELLAQVLYSLNQVPSRRAQLNEQLSDPIKAQLTHWLESQKANHANQPLWDNLVATPTGIDRDHLLVALAGALQNANEIVLRQLWPEDTVPLKQLILWMGQLGVLRQRWAEHYSDPLLRQMTSLIEPAATQTIASLTTPSHWFEQWQDQGVPALSFRSSFWEITLSFLLLENESEFNRLSYLRNLVAALAARHNLSQQALLYAFAMQLPERLKQELTPLFESLSAVSPKLPTADEHSPREPRLVELAEALATADNSRWQKAFGPLNATERNALIGEIRALGKLAHMHRLWAEHFSDTDLLTLVELTQPQASPSVALVIHHQQLFSLTASPKPAIKQSLWQFTLAFLLIERGSEFNRRSYLRALIQHLAAEHNLSQTELFAAMHRAHAPLPEWLRKLQPETPTQNAKLTEWLEQLWRQQNMAFELTKSEQQQLKKSLTSGDYHPKRWARSQQLTSLLKQLLPEQFSQLAPLLSPLQQLLQHLSLPATWFFKILFLPHPPGTIEQWLQLILKQQRAQYPLLNQQQQITRLREAIDTLEMNHPLLWQHPLNFPLLPLQHYLQGFAPLSEQVTLLLDVYPDECWQQLPLYLVQSSARHRWFKALKLTQHLQFLGHRYPQIVGTLSALFGQLQKTLPANQWQATFWQVIYQLLVIHQWQGTLSNLLQQLLNQLIAEPKLQPLWQGDQPIRSLLEQQFPGLNLQRPSQSQRVTQRPSALPNHHPDLAELDSLLQPADAIPHQNRQEEVMTDNETPLNVFNAGIVLAAPYIPTMFQRTGLTEQGQFVSDSARQQGVLLLQELACGDHEAPEYQLMLDKVLCGMPLETPLYPAMELPTAAKSLITGMLNAILQHWKALGSTSIDGLRTTFIQRHGLLTEQDDNWQLVVTPGTFDMLLDRLPWSFQTIKYPWMDKPLFVSWR